MENKNLFGMSNIDIHKVEHLCSKLEELLNNKSYDHYYYLYIATRRCLDSARILAKYSKEYFGKTINDFLEPALQKNEMIGSKANIDVDNIKANYHEILYYINTLLDSLGKTNIDVCVVTLAFFEEYIVNTGFIKRDSLKVLNEIADSYYGDIDSK